MPHSHSGPLVLAPGESRRVRIVLAALVVPLVLATARVTATQVSSCAESAASLGGISDGRS